MASFQSDPINPHQRHSIIWSLLESAENSLPGGISDLSVAELRKLLADSGMKETELSGYGRRSEDEKQYDVIFASRIGEMLTALPSSTSKFLRIEGYCRKLSRADRP